MQPLLIALAAGIAFIVAYHTYGKWLGRKIFRLTASAVCPSESMRDDVDYVPTKKSVVFGHHFTSIAGTGPIVGPAIAVMWGWLPALLWVVFGSIFIGAVHDFGALVVSLRNNGQTVGEIAGRVLNNRVRVLFLLVLFMALTIVLAIFGLVIAAVFRQYPAAIFPCLVQIPLAVGIGMWLHRKGVGLLLPSLLALGLMYVSVIYGDVGIIGEFNAWAAGRSTMEWVIFLLAYSYIASVLPVWTLLQPRDYINALQLITALGLIVVGLVVAAFIGGAPPVEGAARQPLEMVAPMVKWDPQDAPLIFPFLFITIACGAVSGFHCLVSSGTSSKQLKSETDAQFVGYGSMLTEGFLATLVILACCAGLGLGVQYTATPMSEDAIHLSDLVPIQLPGQMPVDLIVGNEDVAVATPSFSTEGQGVRLDYIDRDLNRATYVPEVQAWIAPGEVRHIEVDVQFEADDQYESLFDDISDRQAYEYFAPNTALVNETAWHSRYDSWTASNGLPAKVGAFVDGSANFLKAMGIPAGIAIALMGVLVASFAGTTLDTACRLQRYVVQELARCFLPKPGPNDCAHCGYDLSHNETGKCPECGHTINDIASTPGGGHRRAFEITLNPLTWLANKHGATLFAILVGGAMAAMPAPGKSWSWETAGGGGMILWPMFGATNQLLGGLAFMVIAFYLWRRGKAIWFLIFPLVFMLIMPAWAMLWLIFIADGSKGGWVFQDSPNWVLIVIAFATLALEAWMLIEALLLFPKARGIIEEGGAQSL